MKLFEYKYKDDFGHDHYFTLVKIKRWCLSQICISHAVYGRSWPYINITMGSGRLFGFTIQADKYQFCIEFFTRSWFRND